jgi:hypothetical protein
VKEYEKNEKENNNKIIRKQKYSKNIEDNEFNLIEEGKKNL